MESEGIKIIAQNKKARHDYFIEQTMEAGIVLSGTEVKSIRQGKVNLKDCYASIKDGEILVNGMHISPYEQGNIFNKDPLRDRKLLLHKSEINRLIGYTKQKGMSLVPIQLYFKRGRVKLELGIARGKKLYDKREDIAERDAKREIDRKLKESMH
jgi:SsrA-binding protein